MSLLPVVIAGWRLGLIYLPSDVEHNYTVLMMCLHTVEIDHVSVCVSIGKYRNVPRGENGLERKISKRDGSE